MTSLRNSKSDSSTEDSLGVEVVLISESGKLSTLWLPTEISGVFTFPTDDSPLKIEARQGAWVATCLSEGRFASQTGEWSNSTPLLLGKMIFFESGPNRFFLYSEAPEGRGRNYQRVLIPREARILIGRNERCSLWCNSSLISSVHAVLDVGNSIVVRDNESTNGTYVNGKRICEAKLSVGDQIYLMGLRIIIGIGFLMVRVPTGKTLGLAEGLRLIRPGENLPSYNYAVGCPYGQNIYDRLPRRVREVPHPTIDIEAPPMSMRNDKIPLFLRFGGSAAMSASSLMMGNVLSVVSMLIFPITTQKYTDKQKKEYETRRHEKYGEYLESKKAEIAEAIQEEGRILKRLYPSLSELLHYPENDDRLWERRFGDGDFLTLRLGSGERNFSGEIEYPKRRFDLEEDDLTADMYDLADVTYSVPDAPITVSLIENFVTAVKAHVDNLHTFVANAITQLAILHSYEDLKIVILTDSKCAKEFEWAYALPHVWNEDRSIRYTASNPSEAYRIGESIREVLKGDLAKPREIKKMAKDHPYFVVFALSKATLNGIEVVKEAMQLEKTCGMSVINAYDNPPIECTAVFDVTWMDASKVMFMHQPEQDDALFVLDTIQVGDIQASAKMLSNISLKAASGEFGLPDSIPFLDMFNVESLDDLRILQRWRESDPMSTLAVPIGIREDGSIATLDLHEKFQGPHGLVAGTTGSGKSELLITYILSLSINFHPDEVAFVLIDYKGGGLAGAFVDEERGIKLPHVVGSITNLDGAEIQRSLVSLQSEAERRQRLFNEARSLSSQGTMNIYSYQRLFRAGVVDVPIPHLFVISDEFAELKQQEPEFLDSLISIARIGRSLGIHLILATQKPSGVVNDQIRSNAKFAICLKVQNRSDSMDMLGRPEAASLKNVGRYYIQVGYNEYFALGQSAWSGAPYLSAEESKKRRIPPVQFIDSVGQAIFEGKPKFKKRSDEESQLVATVRQVSRIAEEEGIETHPLWLPALEDEIDLEQNSPGCVDGLAVPIGIFDDPRNQKQGIAYLDLATCENFCIIGDAGSGKSTLLQTLFLQIGRLFAPEQICFYILSPTGNQFSQFDSLSHCGGVLEGERIEKADDLFALIEDEVETRKAKFSEMGVQNYREALEGTDLPLVVVAIDGLSDLPEIAHAHLPELMKKTPRYGIVFIVTARSENEAGARVCRECGEGIAFHLPDKYACSSVVGAKCNFVPKEAPGRGLIVLEDRALEFQTFCLRPNANVQERRETFGKLIFEITAAKAGHYARPISSIAPRGETYEALLSEWNQKFIPLGYSLTNSKKVALPRRQFRHTTLYYGTDEALLGVISNFLLAFSRENASIILVESGERKLRSSLAATLGSDWPDENCYDTSENGIRNFCLRICRLAKVNGDALALGVEKLYGLDLTTISETDRIGYVVEHLKPTLVIFENLAETCFGVKSGEELYPVFTERVLCSERWGIYSIGCLAAEPSQEQVDASDSIRAYAEGTASKIFAEINLREDALTTPELSPDCKLELGPNQIVICHNGDSHPLYMPYVKRTNKDVADEDGLVFSDAI